MAKVSYQAGGMALSVSVVALNSHTYRHPHCVRAQSSCVTSHMDSNGVSSVQYDRWNENNINMNVEASQSTKMRIYNSLCIGSTGVAVKAAGALAALVSIYILGYVTGYYIHRC